MFSLILFVAGGDRTIFHSRCHVQLGCSYQAHFYMLNIEGYISSGYRLHVDWQDLLFNIANRTNRIWHEEVKNTRKKPEILFTSMVCKAAVKSCRFANVVI